ncbi:nuclear factor erythroid 2-related factor 2b [Misgurnus anguillicaudatus]|uniref:nuclear factor erythroid 2-related factor 2b n=1 Tax=Misgurnus anguillicaudatus TaxID=75329 RepID=UPI003CCF62A0
MEDPSVKFPNEPDLVEILWRQDIDLGVEREIFDGCLRQRTEEARRAREREQERELERIMQRLQKLDKETGEFLPSPSSVNSQAMPFSATLPSTVSTQHSPITQNPLLSALLFSKSQKASFGEQAELPSVPDLQYYLDLLESESPDSPLEDIMEICNHNLSHKENSVCDLSELTQTISDSLEVVQPLLCTPCNPVLEACIPALSGDSVYSPINTNFTSSTSENLNQTCLTECQLNSNQSTLSEFTTTFTINTTESGGSPEWSTTHVDSRVLIGGFDDSTSAGSVDLDTSFYATDTISSQSEDEELKSVQSNYTDLLPLSLDLEFEEALYETVTCTKHQTQNKSTKKEPNYKTTRGSRRVSRDEQRARALGLPLTVRDIIGLPVEAFNEAVNSSKLSNAQLTLIRDIRRRGKNKMAAQSCRKRKLDGLVDLEEEVEALKMKKDQGEEEQERNIKDLRDTKEKLRKLYDEVFSQLRNEDGNPYDPKKYKLQLSTDGAVYLLPRNIANRKNTLTEN